ncbi:MAG: hypothetical protein AB7E61_06085 [Acholeplasmataceae bacterium]
MPKNKRTRFRVMKYFDLAIDDDLSAKERNILFKHAEDLSNGKFTIEDKIDHYQHMILFPDGYTKNQIINAQKRLGALRKQKRS